MSLPILQDPDAELPEPVIGYLHKHKLSHLPQIAVGRSILESRMVRACDSNKCTSVCCGTGVLADRAEKERILAYADAVVATMDPDQPKDPADWFDDEEIRDPDFPSRAAIGTQTNARGCIFLNQVGRCVLQKAHMEGRVPVVLKPFYCTAFPVTIDQGMLMLDVHNVDGTPQCCQPSPQGERRPLDVFAFELEHVLGPAGVEELRELLTGR